MAPIIGIFNNLFVGIKQFQHEDKNNIGKAAKYETLTSLFEKTDSLNQKGLTLL